MSKLTGHYNSLLEKFCVLFQEYIDKANVPESDYEGICKEFHAAVRENQREKYLVACNPKLFKNLKKRFSFVPGIKMEVILYTDEDTPDDRVKIINDMWNDIHNLYILTDLASDAPDVGMITKLKTRGQDLPDVNEIIGKFGIDSSMISGLMSKANIDHSLISDVMAGKQIETAQSAALKDEVLNDLRNNLRLTTNGGQVDTQELFATAAGLAKTLGTKYIEKFKSGEMGIEDAAGALMSLVKDNEFREILPVDKINLSEVLAIAPGNIGNLLGNATPELTEEQLEEMRKYYNREQ